jgi:hypothetical protein
VDYGIRLTYSSNEAVTEMIIVRFSSACPRPRFVFLTLFQRILAFNRLAAQKDRPAPRDALTLIPTRSYR